MSFSHAEEKGRPVKIKDEGVPISNNVASVDFTGGGISGSNIGDDVTENVGGTDFSVIDSNMIPDTDDAYDIGENTTPLRWKDIFSSGKTMIGDHSPTGTFTGVMAGDSSDVDTTGMNSTGSLLSLSTFGGGSKTFTAPSGSSNIGAIQFNGGTFNMTSRSIFTGLVNGGGEIDMGGSNIGVFAANGADSYVKANKTSGILYARTGAKIYSTGALASLDMQRTSVSGNASADLAQGSLTSVTARSQERKAPYIYYYYGYPYPTYYHNVKNNGGLVVGSTARGNYTNELFANTGSAVIGSNQGSYYWYGATGISYIRASGYGSFAGGFNNTGGGQIGATERASFAWGFTDNEYSSSTSSVKATGVASFAFGFANANRSILASSAGAFAGGTASSGNIKASGLGSFAWGRAAAGNIYAITSSSFQFGTGTNALAYTVQVGNAGLRMSMTTGTPATLQDGDIWVNNNYVYIRSNGTSCKVTNATL